MNETTPFLRMRGVGKRFGGVVALRDLDWDLLPGEVHCLVGENGCGKSTLIKLVSGVHAPDPGGMIELAGERQEAITPAHARALGVQVIFQDLSLFPNLDVAENIAVASNLDGLARPVRRRRMREIAAATLHRLGVDLPLGAAVASLPIAERQLVAIARGLASEARLLFMDEPTASLTRTEVRRLLGIVGRLKEQGVTIVFVSHRLGEVVEICDRVTVLRDGRKVGTWRAGEVDERRIASLMTGEAGLPAARRRDLGDPAPLLEVEALGRRGEFEDVSFTLRRGEVLGIIGLLGAGRTELALSLFGMTRPDRGEVRIGGRLLAPGSNRAAIAAGIAYVPEDRLRLGLDLRQSIRDNMTVTVLRRLADRFGLLRGGARRALAQSWQRRLAIRAGALDRPVQELSGGNQQRVVLAKWLATEPKVLILDSPTVGVDIKNKAGIYALIRELAEEGVGILLISDEAGEIAATCDRVLHMKGGRIAGRHDPGGFDEHGLEAAVYA